MDLYGKPVQDIYSTFLHLSSTVSSVGSIVYDGRGNQTIVTLADSTCRVGDTVTIDRDGVNVSGLLTIKNNRFFLTDTASREDALSANTVLSLNRELSTVEIRSVNALLPPRQHTFLLPSITLPSLSSNIADIRDTESTSLSAALQSYISPNQDDEFITIQKFYYDNTLREIVYDLYKYDGEGWYMYDTI